ncbi:MAG TPA: helix-turn-helix transcriptional regulator [Cyanophyceae cyanobacterium]
MQAPIKENSSFDRKNLGRRIKQIRGELTQVQFSEIVGVSAPKISRWEDGINEPSASELVAIAAFAKITADELLGIKNSKEVNDFVPNLTDNLIERIAQATAQRVAKELAKFPCETVINGEQQQMKISLSNLARVRLSVLLAESMQQKRLTVQGAVALVGISEGENAVFLGQLIEQIISNKVETNTEYPPIYLEAIAFLCCQVKRWEQNLFGYSVEIVPDTSHDSIESLILTLERPTGNGNGHPAGRLGLNF